MSERILTAVVLLYQSQVGKVHLELVVKEIHQGATLETQAQEETIQTVQLGAMVAVLA